MPYDQTAPKAADRPVTCTWGGFVAGFVRFLPFGLSVLPFGLAFAVAAAQKGLSPLEATLMSAFVMAGTSQLAAIDLWTQPLPLAALALTVFVANLRYFVMGAALHPYVGATPPLLRPALAYSTVDQNWAVCIVEFRAGERDIGKYLGGGFVLACCWTGSTLAGHLGASLVLAIPGVIPRFGLDFVGPAIFAAMGALLWRGWRIERAPWAVAAVAALVAGTLLPGNWYIVIGGVAGGLAGAFVEARKPTHRIAQIGDSDDDAEGRAP
jgi:predicted branched-subunit amino acid permease